MRNPPYNFRLHVSKYSLSQRGLDCSCAADFVAVALRLTSLLLINVHKDNLTAKSLHFAPYASSY